MRAFRLHIVCFLGLILLGIGGCQKESEFGAKSGEIRQPVTLAIEGYDHIDSAQVLFFRKFPNRDSFVYRQVVYDITKKLQSFDFTLPLGIYDILILGNVATDKIIARPPYSRDSVWIYYTGEETIPAIYLGKSRINIGVDTLKTAGMLLMTSAVELTIREVPVNVDQIDIDLLNTDSGFNIDNMLHTPIQPDIIASLYDTRADSSYTIEISSFPTVDQYGQSKLVIRCYDKEGVVIYSGESESFTANMGVRRKVTCAFQTARQKQTKSLKSRESENLNLIWEYDE